MIDADLAQPLDLLADQVGRAHEVGDDPTKGGPYIEADNLKNALIIKGTPSQLKAARDYITLLEGEGG